MTLRLSIFCMVGERASPRIERPPSAQAELHATWNQPTALPSASASAVPAIIRSSGITSNTAPLARRRRSISPCSKAGPR